MQYYPKPYTLEAITVDMGLGMDFSPVAAYCERLGVPFTQVKTDIGPLIFEVRQEKNPCSMCAKMRRGALHTAMAERGITKLPWATTTTTPWRPSSSRSFTRGGSPASSR